MARGIRKTKDKFKFKKQIRIISDMRMIPSVFDEPLQMPENIPRSFSYSGTVLGVPARLLYDDSSKYWIFVQEENQMNRVYNEALNRLLYNGHNSNRYLRNIMGL